MNGFRENPLLMFGLSKCIKKTPPQSFKNFMQREGVYKKLFIPPPNLLEGNGEVFEKCTINN